MIRIEPAASAHREKLFALVSQIRNFSDAEKELAREVITDALLPEKNDYTLLAAFAEQDMLAGFICFGPIPITEKRWDLYWIAVDPHYARQGIGSRLVQAMETSLGKGVRIYIDTSSTEGYDTARTFYEQHGYQPVCLLSDFYKTGDDKIVYCKEL